MLHAYGHVQNRPARLQRSLAPARPLLEALSAREAASPSTLECTLHGGTRWHTAACIPRPSSQDASENERKTMGNPHKNILKKTRNHFSWSALFEAILVVSKSTVDLLNCVPIVTHRKQSSSTETPCRKSLSSTSAAMTGTLFSPLNPRLQAAMSIDKSHLPRADLLHFALKLQVRMLDVAFKSRFAPAHNLSD